MNRFDSGPADWNVSLVVGMKIDWYALIHVAEV